MSLLEFVVMGTPVSVQGAPDARRFWQGRVAEAAREQWKNAAPALFDDLVLRVAYFYVYAPAADLDNIVKPLQDALKGVAFDDDIQIVDLIASMRRKGLSDRIPMRPQLAAALGEGSDFVYVTVDRTAAFEAFR